MVSEEYRLGIENKIMKEDGGCDGFKSKKGVSFDIYLASHFPSISNIPRNSVHQYHLLFLNNHPNRLFLQYHYRHQFALLQS